MAPKPRGLKASSRKLKAPAKQPQPSPPPGDSSDAASTRTFPLDEDALTLSDLFELRLNSQALLLTSSPTSDTQEEARGLLRGILHGCDSLLSFFASVTSSNSSSFFKNPHPAMTSTDDGLDERVKALGLKRRTAPAQVAYLQAFALHELASILPPPPTVAEATVAIGGKKRKIDLREPTKPFEWLDEALERYEVASECTASFGATVNTTAESVHWATLLASDWARAKSDRAVLDFLAGDVDKAKSHLERTPAGLASAVTNWGSYKSTLQSSSEDENREWEDDRGDPSAALLRSLAAFLAVADGFLGQAGLNEIRTVKEAAENVALELTIGGDLDQVAVDRRQLEVEILRGDAAMAEFILLAEAVEDKYRPMEDGEDEEDEEDEGDVVPLPDVEDVREARQAGQKTTEQIRKTISLIEQAPKPDEAAPLKLAQYKKLEEAYLTLSALINPDDEEATQQVGAELEKVRVDGGLEQER
ncbi:hypothetical protein P7C70_g8213, partial [Phenoliferia sp. Uapishka_3]